MKKTLAIVLLLGGSVLPAQCLALPGIMKQFVALYPDIAGSQLADCRTCHLPAPENCLNGYAKALKENKLDFRVVEEMDSDKDRVSNIAEIRAKQLPGSQAGADELFLFTNHMGNISFDHQAHALAKPYLSEGNCDNCHGPEKFTRRFDDSEPLQNLTHPICRGCHEKSGSANAPQRCRECHVK